MSQDKNRQQQRTGSGAGSLAGVSDSSETEGVLPQEGLTEGTAPPHRASDSRETPPLWVEEWGQGGCKTGQASALGHQRNLSPPARGMTPGSTGWILHFPSAGWSLLFLHALVKWPFGLLV